MQAEQQSERERFEADAGPYGFDLTRDNNVTGEPWCDYKDPETGHRWAGWLASRDPHQVPDQPGLMEAAKTFYNLTIADKAVIIRPDSAGKRDAIAAAGERLRAALSHPSTAQGWKLVPVEPTPEMLRAADKLPETFSLGDEYRAMLNAAPTPPAQGGKG